MTAGYAIDGDHHCSVVMRRLRPLLPARAADPAPSSRPDPAGEARRPWRRTRAPLATSRDLVRIVYRDPEHVCERLTLYAARRLAGPSRQWAQPRRRTRSEADIVKAAEELRLQSLKIARTDGLIAGTPFYAALIPGYLNYLWRETRMTLRLAALYGRDPAALRTSAELMVLRGVHPTVHAAEAALIAVRDGEPPAKPDKRRPPRVWYRSAQRLLIFGGFLSPPKSQPRKGVLARLRTGGEFGLGVVTWVGTWIFPVTFMILMAWGCEFHTRQLYRNALALYSGSASSRKGAIEVTHKLSERAVDKRQLIGAAALAVSIAIPVVFITYVVHRHLAGLNWGRGLAVLVAIALVIATAVVGSRR